LLNQLVRPDAFQGITALHCGIRRTRAVDRSHHVLRPLPDHTRTGRWFGVL